MSPDRDKPSEHRPPDLEIGATARADRVRFAEKPEVEVRFRGRSVEESDSGSDRVNLPAEVEPGVTYREVRVGWSARAWVENAAEEPEVGSEADPEVGSEERAR